LAVPLACPLLLLLHVPSQLLLLQLLLRAADC
jgi:hypothetical protein